jgi:hypothetical protein
LNEEVAEHNAELLGSAAMQQEMWREQTGCSRLRLTKTKEKNKKTRSGNEICGVGTYRSLMMNTATLIPAHANGNQYFGCDAWSRLCRAASGKVSAKNTKKARPAKPPPRRSVAGSFPWKPISPHADEGIGGAGTSGFSAFQSAVN